MSGSATRGPRGKPLRTYYKEHVCKALRGRDKSIDSDCACGEYPRMGQILAVDYGTHRLGVAVSDPGGRFALPLNTLELPARSRAAAVARLAQEREIDTVVVGRPVRSAGEDSHLWPQIEKFAASLRSRGLTVVFEDEAYTSAEAMDRLPKGDRKSRGRIDAVAASLILKQYLDRVAKNS